MTLDADEFIRRFLLHVLPEGFHRIRHYGLLASADLQGQHRARQRADGRPNAGGRSAGSARHSRSAHHDRSSPAVPLLRRPHDHCRGLCARRRTPRPTSARRRGQYRDAMTPATASLHYPSAGTSRSRTTVTPAPANPHARPWMAPDFDPSSAAAATHFLRGGRQSALNHTARSVPLQSRCPIKSP